MAAPIRRDTAREKVVNRSADSSKQAPNRWDTFAPNTPSLCLGFPFVRKRFIAIPSCFAAVKRRLGRDGYRRSLTYFSLTTQGSVLEIPSSV